MAEDKESILNGYPNVISYECTRKIIDQMEKNICKLNIGKMQGTGFFCKIPFPNETKMLPIFITNNHVINKELLYNKNAKIELDIKEETENKIIDLNNRMKYTDEEYDITIIEIREEDNINNYLEIDDIIINDILNNINKNKEYKNETVYILQYPENKLSVSYGILDKIYENKKYNFNHKCSTKGGSSGSPILNITNNKVIGIHKEGKNNKSFNIGLFLNEPLKKFIELNNKNDKKILKEFNEKYQLNIPDTKVNEINLIGKLIGNEGLKDLVNIEFKELEELYLNMNNISEIKELEKAKFEKLQILTLSGNEISDINVLEKVNFKELKFLYLLNNKNISDIKILGNVKFEKLERLNLAENNISDISILESVNFKNLKELYLSGNKISNIKVLGKVKFAELEILDLGDNELSNINGLSDAKFKNLIELNLDNNNISDITELEYVYFPKLKKLRLDRNKIVGIKEKKIIRIFKSLEVLKI